MANAAVLDGIRVLELSRHTPIAYATMMLADFGADVVKVEPLPDSSLSGTGLSATSPVAARRVPAGVNRGKRSVAVDLRVADGAEVVRRLADSADVLIEGFRPGVISRLGLDYDALSARNPKLVMISLSGYGQGGPYAELAGHDLNYLGVAGILSLLTADPESPNVPRNLVADLAGGALHAVIAVLAALLSRARTGRGEYVDVSYTDAAAAILGACSLMSAVGVDGFVPTAEVGVHTGLYPYYTVYACRDARLLSLCCLESQAWQALCEHLREPELIPAGPHPDDRVAAPKPHQADARRRLGEILGTRAQEDWFAELSGLDLRVAKVNRIDDLIEDPQLAARGVLVSSPHDPRLFEFTSPLQSATDRQRGLRRAPVRGEHTIEVLRGAGYSDQQIAGLTSRNVVRDLVQGDRGGSLAS